MGHDRIGMPHAAMIDGFLCMRNGFRHMWIGLSG